MADRGRDMSSREAIVRALRDLPAGVVRWASTPSERLPRVASGLVPLDRVLGGGWPLGRLCQVRAAAGRGATSVAVATVADATRRGRLAAWIDGDASLDPGSLRAAGADLDRVLWVRGPFSPTRTLAAVEEVLRAGGFDLVVARPPRERGGDPMGWVRVARAAERSRTVVLALGQTAGAAQVTLDLQDALGRWAGSGPGRVLVGAEVRASSDQGDADLPLAVPDDLAAGGTGGPAPGADGIPRPAWDGEMPAGAAPSRGPSLRRMQGGGAREAEGNGKGRTPPQV